MKNFVVLIIIYTVLLSCKEQKRYIPNLTEFQKELNASFKDVTKSPLAKNDRQNFVSLDLFIGEKFTISSRIGFPTHFTLFVRLLNVSGKASKVILDLLCNILLVSPGTLFCS